MLIKPNFSDEEIVTCLQDAYELSVTAIAFLPLGADFNTAVYRVKATDGADYFLKLRSGPFLEASVSVPRYLADLGIKQVIPPVPTKVGQLCSVLASCKVILYPYVEGHNGIEAKLSEDQWLQFGTTIKKLHSANIPIAITKAVPQETFSSEWRETVKAFLVRIQNEVFKETVAIETAAFLSSKSVEILTIIERAEELALLLKRQPLEYVLCHGDIHGWNVIVDKEGALYVVDWDTLIFAPKERDLMFIGAGIWDSGRTPIAEEALFYKGYGQVTINHLAFCYYRYERIIQDIGEYCKYIFLGDEPSEDRFRACEYLRSNFKQGGTLERAHHAHKATKGL